MTRLAEQRGLPVSTLARDLLLAQIVGVDDSAKALIAKIRAELDDLATRVAYPAERTVAALSRFVRAEF